MNGPGFPIRGAFPRRAVALLLAVAGAALTGCSVPPARPKNVLLFTIDTLRADHLGCYGYQLARTPRIDRLAAEGVRSAEAVTAAPITLPSHATIFTGLYPPVHGVRDNGVYALGDQATTLAERFRDRGFTTRAFVSALVLNRRYGLMQGFEQYDDDLYAEDEPKLFMIRDRRAAKTADHVLAWLDRWQADPARRPFFTWVHFFDPHQPYRPLATDRLLAPHPYDGEIAAVDRAVGRILDALAAAGALDQTLVILTADHGESLGEHGEKTHAIFIYDATLRVPLIARFPAALPQGRVFEPAVGTVDIAPTVLALLGMPGGDEMQGLDLSPAWRGAGELPARPLYAESLTAELGFGMAPLHGLRQDGFQWIRAPRPELYDLKRDPRQLRDLAAADPGRAARMAGDLERFLAASAAHHLDAPARTPDSETIEALQALGYIARAGERAAVPGMDPKDGMAIYQKLEDARHLAQQERWGEAEAGLLEVIGELPGHVSAWATLGLVRLRQGHLDDAENAYREALRLDPDQARVECMLGTIALLRGDPATAERHYRRTLELAPGFVEAMGNLGFIAALAGDQTTAEDWYRRALAADPAFPHVHRRVGDLYYQRGDYAGALAAYRRALQSLPDDFSATVQAGNCARRTGDPLGAAEFFRRAAKLRPDSWIPPYNRACLAAAERDVAQALSALAEAIEKGMDDPGLIAADPDFGPIRQLPEFAAILERAEANGTKATGGG